MNKKIIYIIFIIIVTCLIGFILLKINKKQSNEEIPISTENNIDKLKNIDTRDIESIKYIFYTEGGAQENTITDKESIGEICTRIKNIIIEKKSNLGTTDDGLTIIIKLENEELRYVFEGKNIIINKEQYEVKNLQQLKGYLNTI
ncbi:MAG: hypothetical protein ACLUF5_01595 [Clostridia bacterium]